MKPGQEQAETKAQSDEEQQESRRQPVWHVIVLTVFTMFAYSFVWFFKNWQQLSVFGKDEALHRDLTKQAKNQLIVLSKTSPWVWTSMLVLPGVQLLATTRLFADAARLYPKEVPFLKLHPVIFGAAMTALLVGLLSLAQLPSALHIPEPFYLLYLFSAVPLAVAQHLLNEFWRTQEPGDMIVRQAFSVGELVSLIAGSLFLGLIITKFLNNM